MASHTATFFCDRGAPEGGQLDSYDIVMSADRFTVKRKSGSSQVIIIPDHNVACYEVLKEPEKAPVKP